MKCPHCGTIEDKVVESRTLANGGAIRRRRECISCNFRFTSYERIEDKQFMVVKRDGRREPFDHQKLTRSIAKALQKRPFSQTQIENLVNEIEDTTEILSKGSGETTSTIIGELVLEHLETKDKVAYIRFASVYRQFNDLDEFIREINKVGKEK